MKIKKVVNIERTEYSKIPYFWVTAEVQMTKEEYDAFLKAYSDNIEIRVKLAGTEGSDN